MAENKNKIVFYADWKDSFNHLTDEEAGILIKHFFSYVNDERPILEDRIIQASWIPIEKTLKRDLKKWEQYIEKQQANGKKGGRPKTQITQAFTEKPKKAVSVNDSVSVNEIIDKSITYGIKGFLNDWNKLRKEHLGKPSFLNTIDRDSEDNLKQLLNNYKMEDIQSALIGLFKQKKLPNGMTTMQSNPKHFLKTFESYLTAYHDKNTELYGKTEKE